MLPMLLKELLNIKIRIMNIHTLCLKNKSYLVSLVEIYLFTSPEASMLDMYVIPHSMMHFYPTWPCELLPTLGICLSVWRKQFKKFSPLKPLSQFQPKLVWIILRASIFKNISDDSVKHWRGVSDFICS
jgi:hypothetical protein